MGCLVSQVTAFEILYTKDASYYIAVRHLDTSPRVLSTFHSNSSAQLFTPFDDHQSCVLYHNTPFREPGEIFMLFLAHNNEGFGPSLPNNDRF